MPQKKKYPYKYPLVVKPVGSYPAWRIVFDGHRSNRLPKELKGTYTTKQDAEYALYIFLEKKLYREPRSTPIKVDEDGAKTSK